MISVVAFVKCSDKDQCEANQCSLGLEAISDDVGLSFLTSTVTASASADPHYGHLHARVLHGHR